MALETQSTADGYWPVYKGESFNIWNPDTGDYYAWANPPPVHNWLQNKRLNASRRGGDSPHKEFPSEHFESNSTLPSFKPRIAFRDVTGRQASRTVIACLVPPRIFLQHSAPYFLWPKGDEKDQAFLLGVLCSIPLDWYARRLVERHVSYFIINSFPIPRPSRADPKWQRVVEIAGRLASADDRFAEWAGSVGVACGPLDSEEKNDLIHELDAIVAHLYGLKKQQLIHIFETFHKGWNYDDRLEGVRHHFQRWQSQ